MTVAHPSGGRPGVPGTDRSAPVVPSSSADSAVDAVETVETGTDAVGETAGEAVPAGGGASPETAGFRLGNRPPLTGIRAFVIGTILVYHSNFQTFPGAWTAISVFFVLSGFLITSMLMGEHRRTGRISIGHFYARRALRLLPPLFVTVALLGIYAALVYVPDAAQRVWGDVSAAVFYYADFRSASGREPLLGFLAQAWSLSIEEQFYVLWSLLLLAALALGRRRWAYGLAISGAVASAVAGFWMLLAAPHFTVALANRVYFGFGPRVDALFVGCILGLVATGGHLDRPAVWFRRVVTVLALAATAGLAWMVVEAVFPSRTSLLWWLPLSIVASACLITYFVVRPEGMGSKLVGLAPFVLVGNLTYTIYLVHWPVYVALSPLTTTMPFWLIETLRLVIVFGIALASWYLIERPLMRWRRRALA